MASKPRMPYSTARWQKMRLHQLSQHPLCAYCMNEGIVTEAKVADHIEPHRGDADKFWFGALQSLYARHHNSDKQREERGAVTYGEDGWPVRQSQ